MQHYIDIHTHRHKNRNVLEVVNVFPPDAEKTVADNPESLFSVGLHPWHIDEKSADMLHMVELLSAHKNVVAIGETGLDKLSETDFSVQTDVFKKQVRIAEQVGKPLIIHCVKAFSEILSIQKELRISVPLVFHAFRGKPELARQLLQHGCYLSIGDKAAYIADTIRIIPLNRLFIETDESLTDVKDIYKTIADIKEISVEKLIKQVEQNFTIIE